MHCTQIPSVHALRPLNCSLVGNVGDEGLEFAAEKYVGGVEENLPTPFGKSTTTHAYPSHLGPYPRTRALAYTLGPGLWPFLLCLVIGYMAAASTDCQI